MNLGHTLVQQENYHLGSTAWLLTHPEPAAGSSLEELCVRRQAIEAFCSHASLRGGETLEIYVSTDPPSEFRLDLYRMGYYGGSGARLMQSFGPLRGVRQAVPEPGPGNVIECRWSPTLRLDVPRDWLSGVYLGKLTALASGYEAYCVFVLRDDRPADFLFQCSDLTWQAYNRWPAWRSLYDLGDNRWHTQRGNTVGFDRPYAPYYNGLPSAYNPLTNGSGEFLLWEHPLCFWMEQQGYDVSYLSNLDTHNDPEGLRRAKGFLSVGHDEYWSDRMYDAVAAARDAGVHLAFLGGNSVSGRVELMASQAGAPDRSFRRAEDGPTYEFTNERELMGSTSYGVGAADWSCRLPDHWLFAGTGMKEGDAIPQLVGWEFHGPPLREDPSLVILADGPVLAYGKETKRRYAATIYEGAKANLVFNAATCWWNMLLARPPGAVNPPRTDFSRPDPRVQQITRNLFARIVGEPGEGNAG